jgi:hypothetical protein
MPDSVPGHVDVGAAYQLFHKRQLPAVWFDGGTPKHCLNAALNAAALS